jgi:hypothetical protein
MKASFIFFKKIKIQRNSPTEVARRNDEAMTVGHQNKLLVENLKETANSQLHIH